MTFDGFWSAGVLFVDFDFLLAALLSDTLLKKRKLAPVQQKINHY